ncbi:hypothetical protein QA802_28830 [Streptomyces sp. B21-105]|uniref:hypothetical protein n=1 Tax=Streptomyces sp. B21-105 TaxID=3039417 RepID=UPI002FF31C03
MVLTTTSWLVRGLPRQLMLICEKSRLVSFVFAPTSTWASVATRPWVTAERR